jgi:6-phosphogluconolactonase (cycloisomerase 2 family)
MRMKLKKSSQLLLVSAASLLAAVALTACGTLTVDFVFVTSSKAAGPDSYGEVDTFEINSESGFMRQIPTSPFPSGGRNPVADAVTTDYNTLYVANHDDSSIVQFLIGVDGKLYPENTVNTTGNEPTNIATGIFPVAITVAGSNLFVLNTFQPLPICSPTAPCSGSVAVYPISAPSSNLSSALGTPAANGKLNYWPLNLPGKPADIMQPTAVNVLASGADAYVAAWDTTTNTGYVFGYSVGSGGTLTPLNGGVPFAAGTHPSAIASDPGNGFVYVTDAAKGNILAYSVASGVLSPLSGSPFPAGDQPSAMIIGTDGKFAYVTNALDSTVTAYSIASGTLTRLGTYAVGTQPVAIGIDPRTNHFIFTVNYLGGNVSGYEMNTTDGSLLVSQYSPFTSNALPTAAAAIPHNGSLK